MTMDLVIGKEWRGASIVAEARDQIDGKLRAVSVTAKFLRFHASSDSVSSYIRGVLKQIA